MKQLLAPMNATHPKQKSSNNSASAGFQVTESEGWIRVEADLSCLSVDQIRIGHPGLWKKGPTGCATFCFRSSFLEGVSELVEDTASTSPDSLLSACQTWAATTAQGQIQKGWMPPSGELVEELLPIQNRNIRQGALIRQIELFREPDHFSLQLTMDSFPDNMTDDRRNWLAKMLADANSSWRMVRFDFSEDSGSCVAEVNLTGVPLEIVGPFLLSGYESLRWVVSNLVETIHFLSRTDARSAALELLHAE